MHVCFLFSLLRQSESNIKDIEKTKHKLINTDNFNNKKKPSSFALKRLWFLLPKLPILFEMAIKTNHSDG